MKVLLVGQPNSGKSTLFNAVAGYRSLTSNFPGTTVEFASGRARVNGEVFEVVDLPGLYSLHPATPAEICTREYLLTRDWDVIINVVDASQLARSLDLTLELKDLEAPLMVCLNMMDEATRKGMQIDVSALAKELGIPVVDAVAARGQGIVETFRAALKLGEYPGVTPAASYAPPVERLAQELAELLAECESDARAANPSAATTPGTTAQGLATGNLGKAKVTFPHGPRGEGESSRVFPPRRFRALQLLQADREFLPRLAPATQQAVSHAKAELTDRLGEPPDVVISAARHATSLNLFERVVRVATPRADWREHIDRLLMHPLWGYFFLAAIFLGFFRLVFDLGKLGEGPILALFDHFIATLGWSLGSQSISFAVLKGALLGLAGALAVVLPYLVPFLIGLSLLEDVGYLARVGYLMDAIMHRLGLHGTATIPVLLGYGCSVPAVMATRILASRRDRFVAAFLAVLVPCSARMTVIMALTGFYLGASWALGVYVLNLLVVVLAGNVLARIWPEVAPGMLMAVPAYHRPSARVVLLKTWWRLREFVVVAGPLLIVGSAVLGLIEFFGWQAAINAALAPLLRLLGLPPAVGLTLIFGVLRKELSLLMLMQALGTADVGSVMTAAQIVIFTLFVTFYLPCLATLASMLRELGRKLTLAASAALLGLAFLVGLLARGALHYWM
jgi:ferrous iron transport protein B